MERFEFCKGTSDKFWEVEVKDNVLVIRFGRIGTEGQTKSKSFSSGPIALAEKKKLIKEKIRKGYIASASEGSRPPKAIAAIGVGEHSDVVAEGVAKWLTECLEKKMTGAHFEKIWNSHLDGEDRTTTPASEVPGLTLQGEEEHYWEDELENSYGVIDLYKKAVRNGADKFITLNDNAFMAIIALRGDPGAREIERRVLDDNCPGVIGGDTQWPDSFGPGCPIKSILIGAGGASCTLRNGKELDFDMT